VTPHPSAGDPQFSKHFIGFIPLQHSTPIVMSTGCKQCGMFSGWRIFGLISEIDGLRLNVLLLLATQTFVEPFHFWFVSGQHNPNFT
jgi:hypothetical protein